MKYSNLHFKIFWYVSIDYLNQVTKGLTIVLTIDFLMLNVWDVQKYNRGIDGVCKMQS